MTEEELITKLKQLSVDQLNDLQIKVTAKAAELEQKRLEKRMQRQSKLPPTPGNDVEKMADSLGLDLSGLMREISRR